MIIPFLIDLMAKRLIEEALFNLPKHPNESFFINEEYCILQRTGIDSSCILEIFDSCSFTKSDVSERIPSKPEESTDIGLINADNIYRFKVFIIKNLSNDIVKWVEECFSEVSAGSKSIAVMVISLESKDIILNRGVVYPYEKIHDIIKDCLKIDPDKMETQKSDFNKLMNERFLEPVSKCNFDFHEASISNLCAYSIGLFLLVIIAIFSWISANAIIYFILTLSAVFNLFVIGEVIEGNFGSRKYIVICFSGCIPILIAFGIFPVILNPLFASCGSLIYLWSRVPGSVKKHKFSFYCFIADICTALVFCITSSFLYLFVILFCMFFGFLISGCLNFELEAVKKDRRKMFAILTSAAFAILIGFSFIFKYN